MGPSWVLSAPDGPHFGPTNLAIRVLTSITKSSWGPFYWHGLILSPAQISNQSIIMCRMKIIYPFPNFRGASIEVWEWISNFIDAKLYWACDYLSVLGLNLIHSKRRQNGRHSQTTFKNGFSWMKMYEFRLKFHWSLFLRVPINNIPALIQIIAWHRPGHYLNQ